MFAQRRPEVAKLGAEVEEAAGLLERFVLDGGKRVRPMCAWLGYQAGLASLEAAAVEDEDAVLRAISALELIQACALIHDDIIDSSHTRRGKPTVHRSAQAFHEQRGWRGNSAHYGVSVAILVGDLALSWADDMFLTAGLSPDALRRCLPAWRAMRTEVIGGQLLDISLEAAGSDDPQKAAVVNRFKTAAYTIERPLHIGAAIAGAEETTIAALRGFGEDIGIAFQLRDDLLGVFGDPEITGKPAGDDLREGKRTVLVAQAVQTAAQEDPELAAQIRTGVGSVSTPEEITALAQLIWDTGAPGHVEKQIDALVERGLHRLDQASIPAAVREVLRDLAQRMTKRQA
ncbi:polyprenyl synthetase family protein [Corynebacterium sp. 153RC1]|uniref:polyprenyl synthetase family protein n=1 Tax=unclassified Corynebacterium TaxID=2624378 RepID=UPI00211D080B|nr:MULTISPECIES: polyprenyl synthetase family protein [unclassified Corynebacterium]MCQ9352260.1 polyprenyl synthetase family protein [Corynebacterium sp. 209RC1]MCQ9355436.1 polyprenyl synthetase family protein [Corynebacterium sp. 1222RC1]MCQ9356632.1 polyprenyl synthetase family protein [Corynebacterium sp. 122RC1]MCQ9359827.1 polyprenyl synthetase family protein [Corynebacterium sp. 142RC1]MCQ9360584.1 polyprenyl synthetase family protein [Corynebacterium sp. 153RC1]